MLYNPPTGATNPNAPYVGKNVAAGQQGSKIPPKAVETPQREIVNAIIEAGLNPSNDDLGQLLRAIRSGKLTTYEDSSTVANIIVINPLTPHTLLFRGLPFRVFPRNTNTDQCQLVVNQIAGVPLQRRDGTALQAGDVQAGVPFDCVFDGFVMRMSGFAQSEVAKIVNGPVLWVRTDGSDKPSTKGEGNNAAQAFKTITAALTYGIKNLNYTASSLTIALGVGGIYDAPLTQGIFGSQATLLGGLGTVAIVGDVLNQDSYVVTGNGAPGNSGIIHSSFGTNLTLKGFTVQNNSADSFHNVTAASNSTLYLESMTLSGLNGSNSAAINAAGGANVTVGPNNKLSRSCGYCFFSIGGEIRLLSAFTIVGALSIGVEFARSQGNGKIFCPGGASVQGGSVTGKRFQTLNGGIINVFGQGANFFPGTVAGTSTVADAYN